MSTSSGVDWNTNPLFKQLWTQAQPAWQYGINAGLGGQGLYPVSKAPASTPISTQGLFTGTPSWNMPTLDQWLSLSDIRGMRDWIPSGTGKGRTNLGKELTPAYKALQNQVKAGGDLNTTQMESLLKKYKPEMLADFMNWKSQYTKAKEAPGISYDVPDIAPLMPTSDWWKNMSPEIKQGLYAPYEEAGDLLKEKLNAIGQLGSQGAGVSGAGAAGLGKFWSDSTSDIFKQGWNIWQPAQQTGWNAQLAKNIATQYNLPFQEAMLGYQSQENSANRTQQANLLNAQMQTQANAAPWSFIPSMFGAMSGGLSQNTVVTPQNNNGLLSMLGPIASIAGAALAPMTGGASLAAGPLASLFGSFGSQGGLGSTGYQDFFKSSWTPQSNSWLPSAGMFG